MVRRWHLVREDQTDFQEARAPLDVSDFPESFYSAWGFESNFDRLICPRMPSSKYMKQWKRAGHDQGREDQARTARKGRVQEAACGTGQRPLGGAGERASFDVHADARADEDHEQNDGAGRRHGCDTVSCDFVTNMYRRMLWGWSEALSGGPWWLCMHAEQEPSKLSRVRSPLSNRTGYSALSSYRNSWDNAFPSPGSASPSYGAESLTWSLTHHVMRWGHA